MKLKPSLKWYFISMMFISGVSTVIIMSAVSMHYFIQGIDFSMMDSMRTKVSKYQLTDNKAIQVEHFTIASTWEDLPQLIQDNLDKDALNDDELLKYIDGFPLFGEPKAGYFVLRVKFHGEYRYISSMFNAHRNHHLAHAPQLEKSSFKNSPPIDRPQKPNHFLYIALIGLIGILIFSALPYIILRRVTDPIEKFMLWTKALDKKHLSETVPHFHYSELNSLASMMQESLQSTQEALLREQRFLGYASHELRTPIAVTRTNTELLRKMMAKNISVDKQEQVVDRIERASLTMTDLTETLLWLNREPNKSIPLTPLSIGQLTQQVLEELTYIREGKRVIVRQTFDETYFPLPESLCRIIINNLIRNAFQHTQYGSVTIKQCQTTLIVTNSSELSEQVAENESTNQQNNSELGFGLGLELTKRLVEHCGWTYKNTGNNEGHHVEIKFLKEAAGE